MKIPKVLILVFCFLSVFSRNSHPSSLDELESLPYLAWSDDPDTRQSGVVKYNRNKAFDGYNLYSDDTKYVYLMDMTGQIVYRWMFPVEYARLLDDGDIVAASSGTCFVKLDKDSKLIWKLPIAANHDIEVLADGTFLVVADGSPIRYNNRNVIFDSIVHVSRDGKILDRWSTYDHRQDLQKLYSHALVDRNGRAVNIDSFDDYTKAKAGDHRTGSGIKRGFGYYHLNSIQALPDTILGSKDTRFQKGNWLICFRNISLICILDKDTHQIVWSWGPGILDGPHMPRMMPNGNILVFDNGLHRSYTRLIIIDPVSDKIVWEYKANPPESFYSKSGGSGQLLPNGNFLICESDKAHVFEITPGGEIVWEFFNPEVAKFGYNRHRTIYRMLRIPKGEVSGWLKRG